MDVTAVQEHGKSSLLEMSNDKGLRGIDMATTNNFFVKTMILEDKYLKTDSYLILPFGRDTSVRDL